jgi:hypothetical protein
MRWGLGHESRGSSEPPAPHRQTLFRSNRGAQPAMGRPSRRHCTAPPRSSLPVSTAMPFFPDRRCPRAEHADAMAASGSSNAAPATAPTGLCTHHSPSPSLSRKMRSKNTIWQMSGEKAPDLDSFTGTIYKVCWSIIREDLMAAIHCFYHLRAGPLEHLGGVLFEELKFNKYCSTFVLFDKKFPILD